MVPTQLVSKMALGSSSLHRSIHSYRAYIVEDKVMIEEDEVKYQFSVMP